MIVDHPNRNASPDDAHRFLALLARPGDVFELRALSKRDGKQQIAAGFFDDMAALARAAIERSGRDDGVYVTLNPLHRGLLSRLPANRVQRVGNGDSASDRDVATRRHLLIDIDPIRPAGISSDDAEHAAAIALATRMQIDLSALAWPEPLLADSGNGAHLIYAVDLPRDDGKLIERVLAELSRRYSTPALKVDEKVFNPARISKIYGTLTRKGQSTPERPHRIARICSAPQTLAPVPREILERFAPAAARQATRPAPLTQRSFDLEAWIAQHIPDAEPQSWTGGEHGQRKWLIPTCPFNSTHDRKEAFIVEMHSGAISAGCKHDSCFKTWQELREHFDPGVYQRKRIAPLAPPQDTPPAAPREPGTYRLTQIGNAERFADANLSRMRYVHSWKTWMAWDGRRWKRDETGAEAEAAKLIVEQLFAAAGDARGLADRLAKEHAEVLARATGSDKEAKAAARATAEYQDVTRSAATAHHMMEWATASSYASAVRAMVELARSDPRLVAVPDRFDSDLWSINVLNGTVDLRTGQLNPHRQSDMMTRVANVEYDPESSCERWETFLHQIMPDVQMRDWLQRFTGYCLTGSIDEQSLMFGVGVGQNGKNTFFDTFVTMLGDYATYAAPDLLVLRNSDEHPTGFADLQGRRLVVVSEIDHGRKWAEATIKRLTGDKYVKARFMKKDFFTFLNTLKFCIMANSRPEVRGTDNGIWRRMKVVPFSTSIPDHQRDDKLLIKLEAERAGIFAWAVRGCIEWQAGGLGRAKIIEDATAAYRRDQDMIGEWLAERCWCTCSVDSRAEDPDIEDACLRCGCAIPEKPALAVVGRSEAPCSEAASDIQGDYELWCKGRNDEPWTWRSVRAELLKRPWLTYRRTATFRGILGLRLRNRLSGFSNRASDRG